MLYKILYRSAKNAAIFDKELPSSKPVCMDPIKARFFSFVNPRSKGLSKFGYLALVIAREEKYVFERVQIISQSHYTIGWNSIFYKHNFMPLCVVRGYEYLTRPSRLPQIAVLL